METLYIAPVEVVKSRGSMSVNEITVHFLDNEFYAFRNHCPHMPDKGKLAQSPVCPKTLTIQCPLHQFSFNLVDGGNEREGLRKFGRLTVYQVFIEDNQLFVITTKNLKQEAKQELIKD